MSHVGDSLEGDMSRQLDVLKVDEKKTLLEDSFSSTPDSGQNSGALAFLELLEQVMAEKEKQQKAVAFEDLLLQMMDLGLSKRLATSTDVLDILNNEGWSVSQVAKVWTRVPN